MKINREKFSSILSSLMPGVSTRDISEGLSDFTFKGDRIYSFNDRISVNHLLPENDIDCSVNGMKIYSIIQSMKGEEIEISLKNSTLSLKNIDKEKAKASLKTSEINMADKIPVIPLTEKGWKQLPVDFIEGVHLCCFSVSKDLTRPHLTCISVNPESVVSSDNIRISQFLLSSKIETEGFLLPGLAAKTLTRYGVIEFFEDKNDWVHFKTESECIFSARKVAGQFPDVDSFFDVNGIRVTIPEELKILSKEVSIMAEEEFEIDRFITISFLKKEKRILCSGKGDSGFFEKSIEYEGRIQRDFSFIVNPFFLADVLKKETTMTLKEDLSRALFERSSFRHIMALPVQRIAE